MLAVNVYSTVSILDPLGKAVNMEANDRTVSVDKTCGGRSVTCWNTVGYLLAIDRRIGTQASLNNHCLPESVPAYGSLRRIDIPSQMECISDRNRRTPQRAEFRDR